MRTLASLLCCLSASGCCYQFNSYSFGSDGGGSTAGGTGSSGGTTGSGSSSGSTGGSTTGGTTSGTTGGGTTGSPDGGADGGAACVPPASWPIHCGTPFLIQVDPLDNVSGLSVAPLYGGSYLVSYANFATIGQSAVLLVGPDGGVTDAGGLAYPVGSVALAAMDGGVALVSGGESAAQQSGCGASYVTGCYTQIECAAPYSAAPTVHDYVYDSSGDQTEVDSLALASGAGGLAVAWADVSNSSPGSNDTGIALLGIDPAGGCALRFQPLSVPAAASASLTLSTLDVAAVGSGFDVVRAYNGGSGGSIVLDLGPDGGQVVRAFGAGTAEAAFGDPPSVFALDGQAGVELLALDGGALETAATLSNLPDGGFVLAARSCGPGCGVALWAEPAGQTSTGSNRFYFRYGFAAPSGCAFSGVLPGMPVSALPPTGAAPQFATAVGAQPGSALLVFALDDQGTSSIYASRCTP